MRSKLNTPDKPLSLREAAAYLGIAPSTLRERVLAGAVEAERDGKRWIFYPLVLEDYRRSRRYALPYSGAHPKANSNGHLTEEEAAILAKYGIEI